MARRVRTGLEVLLGRPARVRGLRVGLVANPASITSDLVHASLAIARLRGVRLGALFGPEHGITADAQDLVEVGHSRAATGLPVHSLYGETRIPTPEMLAGLMPAWLAGLIIFRYLGAGAGGILSVMYLPNVRIRPSIIGKACTATVGLTIFLTIARR